MRMRYEDLRRSMTRELTSWGLKPSRTKSSFRILNVPEVFEEVTKKILIIISRTCYVEVSDNPEEEGDGVGGQLSLQVDEESGRCVNYYFSLAAYFLSGQSSNLSSNLKHLL